MGACRSSAHRLRIARASRERLARPGRCGGGGGGEHRSATRPASSRRFCLPNVQQAKAEQKVETSKSLVLSLYAAFVLVFFILHAHCWLLHGNAISPPVLCELGGAAHTALCISLSFDALRCLSLKRRIARFETEEKTATLPRVMCVDRLFCMAFFRLQRHLEKLGTPRPAAAPSALAAGRVQIRLERRSPIRRGGERSTTDSHRPTGRP